MRALKATVGNNSKRNLERDYKGGGWLTTLTKSQDGTQIYREEFRDALRQSLDPTLHKPPPPQQQTMSATTHLRWSIHVI